jgi:hypothetical protein
MKKLLSIIIAFTLLFSVAYADGLSDFVENWNKIAYIYDTPEFFADNFEIDGDYYEITGEDWEIGLIISGDTVTKAALTATDGDIFLKMCTTLGTTIVRKKTSDDLFKYRANVLDMYLSTLSGKEPREAAFGYDYAYMLKAQKGKYSYLIVKQ